MFEPGPHGRAKRVGADRNDFGIALLQKLGRAGECASGADGRDEGSDFAPRLLPDFRPGGFIVSEAIVYIVKLIGPKPAVLLRQPLSPAIVVARVAIRFL